MNLLSKIIWAGLSGICGGVIVLAFTSYSGSSVTNFPNPSHGFNEDEIAEISDKIEDEIQEQDFLAIAERLSLQIKSLETNVERIELAITPDPHQHPHIDLTDLRKSSFSELFDDISDNTSSSKVEDWFSNLSDQGDPPVKNSDLPPWVTIMDCVGVTCRVEGSVDLMEGFNDGIKLTPLEQHLEMLRSLSATSEGIKIIEGNSTASGPVFFISSIEKNKKSN